MLFSIRVVLITVVYTAQCTAHWYVCGGYMYCPPNCKTIDSWPCNLCSCPEGTQKLDETYKLQPCAHASDCARPNQHCVKDYCLCDVGYTMIPQSLECLKNYMCNFEVPTAFNETCHYRGKWVTCNGTHLQKECDQTPGSATYGRCTCKKGYAYDVVRSKCLSLKSNLTSTCRTNADCTIAYSYCNHRVCTCRKGFISMNGICTSTEKMCPYIPKKKMSTYMRSCTVYFNSTIFDYATTGCSKDGTDFCFTYAQEEIDQRAPKRPGRHPGHCCSNPTAESTYAPVCPESRKIYDTCEILHNGEVKKACPPESQCLRAKAETVGVCCRLPCNLSRYVNFGGQCYALNLELDSPCDFSEQCPNYAVCVPQAKICKCKSGFTAINSKTCRLNV